MKKIKMSTLPTTTGIMSTHSTAPHPGTCRLFSALSLLLYHDVFVRLSQIFVELGRVKRAGLVLTMSSTADRENLRQVSAHCREHGWVRQNGHLSQCANNTTTAAAVAAATYDRQKALDVAIAALGLVA